jgi:type II secretory pathway component PulM
MTALLAHAHGWWDGRTVRERRMLMVMAALETDHGIKVCSLGVMENADATLNIDGALGQGGCVSAG